MAVHDPGSVETENEESGQPESSGRKQTISLDRDELLEQAESREKELSGDLSAGEVLLGYFQEMKAIDDKYLDTIRGTDGEASDAAAEKAGSERAEIYHRYWCRVDDYWLANSYPAKSDFDLDESAFVRSGHNGRDLVVIEVREPGIIEDQLCMYILRKVDGGWRLFDKVFGITELQPESESAPEEAGEAGRKQE